MENTNQGVAQDIQATTRLALHLLDRVEKMTSDLSEAADETGVSAPDPQDVEVDRMLEEALYKISRISENRSMSLDLQSMDSLIVRLCERVQEMADAQTAVTGILTGFFELDRMTTGMRAGDLIVLAARPGMGRSALAMNIAGHVALKKNQPVAVFSMSMGAISWATCMISAIGRINTNNLSTGRLTDEEWVLLSETVERLGGVDLYIDETSGLTFIELSAKARRLKRQCGDKLGLIVVDCLQMMSDASNGNKTRATDLGEISRNLKDLAQRLHCPVIALSQLHADIDARADKRPLISDLQEFGTIADAADLIMFLYRDDYDNENAPEPSMAEVIIAKQRNGPTGTVPLVFVKSRMRFENLIPMTDAGDDF
jgi:replicative DNA helicase